jgi:hypothetical protein
MGPPWPMVLPNCALLKFPDCACRSTRLRKRQSKRQLMALAICPAPMRVWRLCLGPLLLCIQWA